MEYTIRPMRSELTILIHYHKDSPERERNFVTIVKYLKYYGFKIRIFIEGASWDIAASDLGSWIYNFDELEEIIGNTIDSNGIMHRTKALNYLLKDCRTKYAAIYDADVIIPINQLDGALSMLEEHDHTAVSPYGGTFWRMNEAPTEQFAKSNDIKSFMASDDKGMILYHCGGAILLNVEKYLAIGGENENIVGYGPEDSERWERINKLGTAARVDGDLYHMNHPININSTLEQPYNSTNQDEYKLVRDMPADQLREYVKTWRWAK